MSIKVKKIQDDDYHWYWIPEDQLKDFNKDLKNIEGKQYMDCPDAFDDFNMTYDTYRTGGCSDLPPDVFDGYEVEFIN